MPKYPLASPETPRQVRDSGQMLKASARASYAGMKIHRSEEDGDPIRG